MIKDGVMCSSACVPRFSHRGGLRSVPHILFPQFEIARSRITALSRDF